MTPKWATPARKAQLVRLFQQYGNKCLHGHPVCPDPEHYVVHREVGVLAWEPRVETARHRDGEPIRDRDGNAITYTVLKPRVVSQTRTEGVSRLFDLKAEEAIRYWVSDDVSQRAAQWREEQRRMHRDQRRIRQGRFDTVSREQFLASQPSYYIEALGVDALTFRAVAKVRIPSTGIRIFVDVGDAVHKASKSARRKAARYGTPLPKTVDDVAQKAVEEWWAR
jgi:hypothetical protein